MQVTKLWVHPGSLYQIERQKDIFYDKSYSQNGLVCLERRILMKEKCRSLDIKIPEDMEILACGMNESFNYSMPAISYICQPIAKYAEVSLDMIISLIKSKTEIPMIKKLKPIFHFRESCGKFIEETCKSNKLAGCLS